MHRGGMMGENSSLDALDMELEMLKRKRQMIQEQRQMIEEQQQLDRLQSNASVWATPRHYDYQQAFNQPQQSYNQQPLYNQFSDNYSDSYKGRNKFVNQKPGFKRPANIQPKWQNQPEPKRFAGSQRGGSSNYRPLAANQQKRAPNANPPVGKSFNSAPRANSTFNTGRITKPKFTPAPLDKFKAMPVDERKNLIAKSGVKAREGDTVLRSNVESSPQVTGRLELALGQIVKGVRTQFSSPPHNVDFSGTLAMKALKQELRNRIHEVMLGKPVVVVTDIVTAYRKAYPKSGDKDLIELMEKAKRPDVVSGARVSRPGASRPLDTTNSSPPNRSVSSQDRVKNDPEAFKQIKSHVAPLLGNILDEMFTKLQKMYEEDATKTLEEAVGPKPTVEPKPDLAVNGAHDKVEEEMKKDDDVEIKEDIVVETANGAAGEEAKLPVDAVDDEPAETVGEQATDDKDAKVEPAKEADKEKDALEQYYERMVVMLIKRKLPAMLPKYKKYLMSIIASDTVARKHKSPADDTAQVDRGDKVPIFVKVFGKPNLPKRHIMSNFLKDYQPMSVKKHRTVHNLLFVGFWDMENVEKLLAQSNCTVGTSRIVVKLSNNQQNPDVNKPVQAGTENTENQSAPAENSDAVKSEEDTAEVSDPPKNGEATKEETADQDLSVIDAAMDSEITDLLSSIDEGEKGNDVIIVEDDIKEEEKVVEKQEGTPASNIRTRRSSRMVQK